MAKRIVFILILILSMFNFSYAVSVGDHEDYIYTGDVQTFTASVDGWYQLEVYGAKCINNIIELCIIKHLFNKRISSSS